MLKRNRKLNKAALIRESREYGASKQTKGYEQYPVFYWLNRCHGTQKAVEMLEYAIKHRAIHCGLNCPVPSGFIIWSDTPHYKEWSAAEVFYEKERNKR